MSRVLNFRLNLSLIQQNKFVTAMRMKLTPEQTAVVFIKGELAGVLLADPLGDEINISRRLKELIETTEQCEISEPLPEYIIGAEDFCRPLTFSIDVVYCDDRDEVPEEFTVEIKMSVIGVY